MKKLITLALVMILTLTVGGVVYAHNGDDNWNFQEMLPMMKQMHPDRNEEQLEDMYQDCHDENENDMMSSVNQAI